MPVVFVAPIVIAAAATTGLVGASAGAIALADNEGNEARKREEHWETPQEIMEHAEVWRRNPRGELVAQSGEVVSEQNLLQRKRGNSSSERRSDAGMFLWDYPEFAHTGLRTDPGPKSSDSWRRGGGTASEFVMPPSVNAHGVALTELVEELANLPADKGLQETAPTFTKDYAQALQVSNDPDHLRRAAKIYEGMAMIHESMGQKLQAIAMLEQAVECQERAMQLESGLQLPDPADRTAHEEVGDWNASSEQFRMEQLKTKVRARVTEDTEEGAQDVDNIESSRPTNPTSLSPSEDLVFSQVLEEKVLTEEELAWAPVQEATSKPKRLFHF